MSLKKSGEPIWLEILATTINYAGQSTCMGNVIDLTSKRQAEEALRESEEKYRSFIDNSPIAMYTLDTEGNITYGNKKLLEMTGYTREDWLNKPFHPVVHPDDLDIVMQKVGNRLAGKGTTDPYEIRIFNSSGEIMWVKINTQSIYDTDEKVGKSW